MTHYATAECEFIRCTNCGEIMAASVTGDGRLVPLGVEKSGKCGDGEFEVLSMSDNVPGSETLR